jgi:hypothetical protein
VGAWRGSTPSTVAAAKEEEEPGCWVNLTSDEAPPLHAAGDAFKVTG